MAGFIEGTIDIEFADSSNGGPHGPPAWSSAPDWVKEKVWEIVEDRSRCNVTLGEVLPHVGDFHVGFSGETDADPVMSILKNVENDSGFTWTGYRMTLPDGGPITFVAGTATSDKMTVALDSPYEIRFSEPQAIPQGDFVTFEFDVLVPSSGPFTFTLTQTPLPEPATLAFVSLGSLGVLAHRRRR